MIQDIGNHKVETVFIKEEKLGKENYVIGFEGEYVYLKKEDGNFSFFASGKGYKRESKGSERKHFRISEERAQAYCLFYDFCVSSVSLV